MNLNESIVEDAALVWFGQPGRAIATQEVIGELVKLAKQTGRAT